MLRISKKKFLSSNYEFQWLELTLEIRTLFVSTAGLENAKKLISAYKQGQLKSMTPELWHAKKIVDSTLHPGWFPTLYHNDGQPLNCRRHWTSGFFTTSHVMLCHLQPNRHGWDAHTGITSTSS